MESERAEMERYRYTEYLHGSSTIFLIQDAENDNAWIQSTAAVPAER